MIWQDVVIMVCCFGFAIALIPSIRGRDKPAKSSCIMTAILLSAIGVCFATLHLWLSMASEIVCVIAWLILLFQKRGIE